MLVFSGNLRMQHFHELHTKYAGTSQLQTENRRTDKSTVCRLWNTFLNHARTFLKMYNFF